MFYVVVFALSAVSLGYDLGVIAVAKDKAGIDLGLTDRQVEWMVGVLNLASAIGGLLSGGLADCFGRRQVLLVAGVLQAVGAITMAFADNLTGLVAGRVIAGLGVGAALMCGPVYTAELSPQK